MLFGDRALLYAISPPYVGHPTAPGSLASWAASWSQTHWSVNITINLESLSRRSLVCILEAPVILNFLIMVALAGCYIFYSEARANK